MDTVTMKECLDMKLKNGMASVLNDGKLMRFEHEKSTDTDSKSEQCF